MVIVLFAVILLAIGTDQLTKLFIYGRSMPLIRGCIHFEPVENRGMVWGLLNNVKGAMTYIAVITAIVIVLFIVMMVKYRKKMGGIMAASFALVIGGAIGNLIDRIALGYVRDFICLDFIDFPVFNAADVFVTVGAAVLAVMFLFTKQGREFYKTVFGDKKPAADAETEKKA